MRSVRHLHETISLSQLSLLLPLKSHLCFSLKRVGENSHISLNRPLIPQELHVSPIDPDFPFLALLLVFITSERSEAPILRDDDLLAAWEFVLGATEGFDGCGFVWKEDSVSCLLPEDWNFEQELYVRLSRVRTERRIWPMFTRATVPLGLPQAPRIPVWSLSAPAHDNILLMRTTWYGWARTRRWKPSFPATLTRYLHFVCKS